MNQETVQAPPRLARWLLRQLFFYQITYDIEGDMAEAFDELTVHQGTASAQRWYWRHTLKSSFLYARNELKGSKMVLQSVVKTAFRNLRRQRFYAIINLLGFGVALAAALLIFLFVGNELRYDRHHDSADQIYRLVLDANMSGEAIHTVYTPAPLAAALKTTCPEVEETVRLRIEDQLFVEIGEVQHKEEHFLFADSTFFNVFTVPILYGDEHPLRNPSNVAITPATAKKYFGEDDPIGKTLRLTSGSAFTVSAVVQPMPETSHFQYDFIASLAGHPVSEQTAWVANVVATYARLRKDFNRADFADKITEIERNNVGPFVEQYMGVSYDDFLKSGSRFGFSVQKMLDVHLHSHLSGELGTNGDFNTVLVLTAIAIIILAVASINFINLSTAQSIRRANEVGIRKVMGSIKSQLIKQFLLESVFQCVLALLLAILLVALAHPHFENIIGRTVPLNILTTWYFVPTVLAAVLLIGVLSGSYPAWVLASFQPVQVLKGKIGTGLSGQRFRSTLVVFQFTASIALLVSGLVIHQQLQYIRNKPLGFDPTQVLVIRNANNVGVQGAAFKEALLQNSQISHVTFSTGLPLVGLAGSAYQKGNSEDTRFYTLIHMGVDYDFMDTYDIDIVEGRFFNRAFSSDTSSIIVNQTALELLAWEQGQGHALIPIGNVESPTTYSIIGVYKDFHTRPLQEAMFPLLTFIAPPQDCQFCSIRIMTEKYADTVTEIEKLWKRFVPGEPMDYLFFDDQFNDLYETEIQLGKVVTAFTVLALVVACMGLFGLVSLTARMRTKEIGIRKVMGASVGRLIALLTRQIVIWVALAMAVAWPVSWWAMSKWLDGFAYRISLSPLVFVTSGGLAMLIAVATVMQVAHRAATRRPVETIRYE